MNLITQILNKIILIKKSAVATVFHWQLIILWNCFQYRHRHCDYESTQNFQTPQ
jgi:hypothetical protein